MICNLFKLPYRSIKLLNGLFNWSVVTTKTSTSLIDMRSYTGLQVTSLYFVIRLVETSPKCLKALPQLEARICDVKL